LVRELADDGVDVAATCRVLKVSRSGYYEWRDPPLSERARENELLVKYIEQIHSDSRGTYGSPRVHAELTLGLGLPVNRNGSPGSCARPASRAYRRTRSWITVRDPAAEPAPDLVNRHFTVDRPDRWWITDIASTRPRKGRSTARSLGRLFSPDYRLGHR
jgi:putative transposase